MRTPRFCWCLFPPVLLLVMTSTSTAQNVYDELNAVFTSFLETEFKHRPVEASRLGDHRFDNRMDDLTPRARAAWTENYRRALADLPKRVQVAKLSRSGKIDYDILHQHLTKLVWLAENTRPFEEDP